MKAAAIYQQGENPVYTTFPDPVVDNENECVITVTAAAIKHFDKSRISGKHYSSEAISQPKIIGGDGVGIMPDGSKIYALGESGMIAEKAVVNRDKIIPVPKGLDDAVAAALPNAVAGSAMALLFRGKMKEGDTVLINGATGFTGTLAVQLAKHYGAGKIIVTGRNEQSLNNLLNLGADEIVSLQTQKGEDFIENIKVVNAVKPIDVVVDYLWGNSAEWILSSLKGNGKFSRKINFVSVGAMSGDTMQLSSQILRSVDLHLCGSGIGSWTKDEMNLLFRKIIPEVFQLAAENKLQVNITKVPLADIERISTMEVNNNHRLVIMCNDFH